MVRVRTQAAADAGLPSAASTRADAGDESNTTAAINRLRRPQQADDPHGGPAEDTVDDRSTAPPAYDRAGCPELGMHSVAAAEEEDQPLEAGAEAGTLATAAAAVVRTGPRPGSGMRCSLGAGLAALFTAGVIHYYCHQGGVAASAPGSGSGMPSVPGFGKPIRLKGIAGPFDVELEKAELCEKEKQGVGAAKMDWGEIAKDKDVPKRYHISGRGSFNYNTSDDLAAKFLLASWAFPGRWVTYYSNTFTGGCSMAKNFSPEKWRRVSLLVFGHENGECPFPPMRMEVNNFTVEHKQSLVKEFIYGRWKVENQIIDISNNNRPVSCGRAIFRVVPKKDRPMPAVVPPYDNSDRMSFELIEPPDAPP